MKLQSALLILFFILITLALAFFTIKSIENSKVDVILKVSKDLLNELNIQEKYAEDIGFVVLTTISENPKILESLKKNDRNIAIQELNKLVAEYKKKTNIENLKIHIHTADMRSFIRHWKLDKYGDDLRGFRKTIVRVHDTKEPVFAFEIGRIGLTLRTLLPIEENGIYFGSIEFIQQFDQVPDQFEKYGNQYLLLMDKSYLTIARYLLNAPDIANYKVSSKYFNKDFLQEAKNIDFKKLKEDKYYFTDNYMLIYKEILDINNNIVGIHLLATSKDRVYKLIKENQNSIVVFYIFGFIIILLIALLLYFLNKK